MKPLVPFITSQTMAQSTTLLYSEQCISLCSTLKTKTSAYRWRYILLSFNVIQLIPNNTGFNYVIYFNDNMCDYAIMVSCYSMELVGLLCLDLCSPRFPFVTMFIRADFRDCGEIVHSCSVYWFG